MSIKHHDLIAAKLHGQGTRNDLHTIRNYKLVHKFVKLLTPQVFGSAPKGSKITFLQHKTNCILQSNVRIKQHRNRDPES
ncbi:hypothetical protein PAHAL_9G037100 [Panicum hallii]|uniref:Uncharacterized protein n=1 Tax=Panicum hallii TaxID=206008 RepID=A0A2S3IHK6_9POAL|nr:hypothetical protein PAHAL_9G037100 [Panicum hallii]